MKNNTEHAKNEAEKIEPIKKQKVQYMFFTHSSYANFDIENILKPNAALLIEDKTEIDNAQEFFLSERSAYYKCGYHYAVLFCFNTDSLYRKISLNKKCEDFAYQAEKSQKLLNHYAKQLETKPSHYIYNIEISVSIVPKDVKKEFRDNGLIVFSFENDLKRFPTLTFLLRNNKYVGENSSDNEWKIAEQENKNDTEKVIIEILNKIKSVSKVINISEIDYYCYGRVGDEIKHKGTVELFFENEKELNLATEILRQTTAEIKKVTIPETYTLQLIDIADNIENIKQKLEQYKFIKNISEYK